MSRAQNEKNVETGRQGTIEPWKEPWRLALGG
jgi:hypothetical protein